ncbi:hypothetical protein ABZ436_23585 [Micromonospora matsumotoense]|uniref:hypothetical protein n=1 Tax=Micromonospora matsumotoense TaxID=121616 RepID=UPI0033F1A94E
MARPGSAAFAVLAGIRALVAGEPFARWAWTTIAVLMLILCAVYVIWTKKKRS